MCMDGYWSTFEQFMDTVFKKHLKLNMVVARFFSHCPDRVPVSIKGSFEAILINFQAQLFHRG